MPSWLAISDAVAPSRTMRSTVSRNEISVARGIEVDSNNIEVVHLAGLYQVTNGRETSCRYFARNFVSRDRLQPSRISARLGNTIRETSSYLLEKKVDKATVKVTYFETENLSVPVDLTLAIGF